MYSWHCVHIMTGRIEKINSGNTQGNSALLMMNKYISTYLQTIEVILSIHVQKQPFIEVAKMYIIAT